MKDKIFDENNLQNVNDICGNIFIYFHFIIPNELFKFINKSLSKSSSIMSLSQSKELTLSATLGGCNSNNSYYNDMSLTIIPYFSSFLFPELSKWMKILSNCVVDFVQRLFCDLFFFFFSFFFV